MEPTRQTVCAIIAPGARGSFETLCTPSKDEALRSLMPLEPPIIIVGDGQVELFSNSQSVQRSVEAVDAGLFRVYDSRGRPMRIAGQYQKGKTLGVSWGDGGSVTVEAMSDEPSGAEELRVALLDWWERTGGSTGTIAEASSKDWPLARLVGAIAARDGVE
jgi:hypothetical protein